MNTHVFPVIILLLALHGGLADAAPARSALSEPYCGIYSVYGALKALGLDDSTTLDRLLVPKYLESKSGSTIRELAQAAADFGAHTLSVSGLSSASLRGSECPLILHVTAKGGLRRYHHWIVFLGMEDGMARVLDGPGPCETIPIADVMSRWDGTALAVSDGPISVSAFVRMESQWQVATVLMAALVVVSVRAAGPGRPSSQRTRYGRMSTTVHTLSQSASIMIVASAVGATAHAASEEGFFHDPERAKSVAGAHPEAFFRQVDRRQMQIAVGSGSCVIVDARLRRDYERAHIAGAISLPIDTSIGERRTILRRVPKDSHIIVYCQSYACQYDDQIGAWLESEGFSEVFTFPGGWDEWKAHERQDR